MSPFFYTLKMSRKKKRNRNHQVNHSRTKNDYLRLKQLLSKNYPSRKIENQINSLKNKMNNSFNSVGNKIENENT
jgi:hypothetical protein